MKAKRLERIALAEQLASSEQRHPGAVLLDATHTADVLARNARAKIETGQAVTPRMMRELVDSTIRAAALARSALSADAEALVAQSSASNAVVFEAAVRLFMDRMQLSRDPAAERALREAVKVAAGARSAASAAVENRRRTFTAEEGDQVAGVIRKLVTAIGLNDRDLWVQEVVAGTLHALNDGATYVPSEPPRSWWHQLMGEAARRLGMNDPTKPAPMEILPPAPREIEGPS